MKKYLTFFFSLVIVICFSNCGGSTDSQKDAVKIPEWYSSVPSDVNYLFSSRTSSQKDLQQAVDEAVYAARTDVSNQVDLQLQSLLKKFDTELGLSNDQNLLQQFDLLIKLIVTQNINNSNVQKKEVVKDGENWKAYILVSFEIGKANQAMLDQIKNNNSIFNKVKSSNTFDELNKDVKEYVQWKSTQIK
ncbi:MAG: hypothetical protein NTX22_02295 [Ignavibacteriales bacterium]|nr:hypothetical protein [Ignavibacteriales bacterium]